MEIRHSIILHIIERVNEHILLGIPQQQIENVTIPASKETYSIHVTVHTCKLQALIPVYMMNRLLENVMNICLFGLIE